MIELYYGSNVAIEYSKPLIGRRKLDFGEGFYATSDFEQASKWARLKAYRALEGEPIVNVYLFDESKMDSLRVLSFAGPDKAWLEFVVSHRKGIYQGPDYDLIHGPMANDSTIDVINTITFLVGLRKYGDSSSPSSEIEGSVRFHKRKEPCFAGQQGGKEDMNEKTAPGRIAWLESKMCSYIAEEKKVSNLEAFRLFLASKTHGLLLDNRMKLWHFSPEALFEIYKAEEKRVIREIPHISKENRNEQGV